MQELLKFGLISRWFELGTIKLSPGLILGFLIIFTVGTYFTTFIQSLYGVQCCLEHQWIVALKRQLYQELVMLGIFLAAIIAFHNWFGSIISGDSCWCALCEVLVLDYKILSQILCRA